MITSHQSATAQSLDIRSVVHLTPPRSNLFEINTWTWHRLMNRHTNRTHPIITPACLITHRQPKDNNFTLVLQTPKVPGTGGTSTKKLMQEQTRPSNNRLEWDRHLAKVKDYEVPSSVQQQDECPLKGSRLISPWTRVVLITGVGMQRVLSLVPQGRWGIQGSESLLKTVCWLCFLLSWPFFCVYCLVFNRPFILSLRMNTAKSDTVRCLFFIE